jgi:hypothetical protein
MKWLLYHSHSISVVPLMCTRLGIKTAISDQFVFLSALFYSNIYDPVPRTSFEDCILDISRVQMKSWAGEALETVNCCTFLKRRLIGSC